MYSAQLVRCRLNNHYTLTRYSSWSLKFCNFYFIFRFGVRVVLRWGPFSINILGPEQNGRQFTDNILKYFFAKYFLYVCFSWYNKSVSIQLIVGAKQSTSMKTKRIEASSNTKMFYNDDVIKWKPFPRCWPTVRGIHRSPVDSPPPP